SRPCCSRASPLGRARRSHLSRVDRAWEGAAIHSEGRRTARCRSYAFGRRRRVAFGLLLIVIGLLLLVDSLNLFEGVGFEELWPVLVIAVGVAIIYDRIRRSWRRR